jgi:hypothetical protein
MLEGRNYDYSKNSRLDFLARQTGRKGWGCYLIIGTDTDVSGLMGVLLWIMELWP